MSDALSFEDPILCASLVVLRLFGNGIKKRGALGIVEVFALKPTRRLLQSARYGRRKGKRIIGGLIRMNVHLVI